MVSSRCFVKTVIVIFSIVMVTCMSVSHTLIVFSIMRYSYILQSVDDASKCAHVNPADNVRTSAPAVPYHVDTRGEMRGVVLSEAA